MANHRLSTALWKLFLMCILVTTSNNCQVAGRHPEAGGSLPGPTSKGDLKRGLERVANELLAIIEKGDPKEFPSVCSVRGIVLGVDMPPIAVAVVRKHIAQKQGVYCGLFDTKCLRQEDEADRAKAGASPRPEPLYSYRDRLLRASARDVKVAVSGRLGNVRIVLTENVQPAEPMEFEFVYEGGGWKLSAIPFY
jgi:hypothetical protein